MSSLLTTKLLGVGKASQMVPALSAVMQQRGMANEVKYLKTVDGVHMRRGRGGRSSFSGVVCTVFGATGFVGRYVANRLGKTGTQMIFPYRCDSYEMSHLKCTGDLGQVNFTPFHLLDEESIARAVRHSHVVINLIGRDWDTRNFTIEQCNLEGAERLARVSKSEGVERFIHMSALNCDRDYAGYHQAGGSRFLKAKRASEAAVRSHYPDAVIFRPSDVYGMEDRFLRYYGNIFRYDGHSLSLPHAGRGIFKQPVFVSDVAQGIVNAVYRDVGQGGGTYQCVGPRRYEQKDMVEWFLRVLRRRSSGNRPGLQTELFDMKYFPLYLLKAKANKYFNPHDPIALIEQDRIEREAVSDEVLSTLPTLEDLDVTPDLLEHQVEWLLRVDRAHSQLEEEVGDYDEPWPAPFTTPAAV